MNVSGYEDNMNYASLNPGIDDEEMLPTPESASPPEPASAPEPTSSLESSDQDQVLKSVVEDEVDSENIERKVKFEGKSICDYILDNWVLVVALFIFVMLYVYEVV